MRLPLGVKLTLTTSVVVAIAIGSFALVTGKSLGGGVPWISAGALLVSGILGAIWQSIRVVRPLREMAHAAGHMASGDLAQRVPVHSRDEVGALAHTLNTMAEALAVLMAEREQQARVNQELELARRLQKSMLPPKSEVSAAGALVCGSSRPTSRCGGDWWLCHALSPSRVLLVVADATGHGVGAALVAATARGALLAVIQAKGASLTARDVMRAFAASISRDGNEPGGMGEDSDVPMTALAVIADREAGELEYENRGMPFPLLCRGGELVTLTDVGGVARTAWQPGATLVLYSDGLPEQQNAKGLRMGDRRIAEALRAAHGLPAAALHQAMVDASITFADGAAPDDDITLVICQAQPRPALDS